MTRSTLGGQHAHENQTGQNIQIWMRDGKYLARGRRGKNQFGVTLGADDKMAGHQLRRLLTELEDGTFVPRSEAGSRRCRTQPIPRHTLRTLINAYIEDKDGLRGPNTARDCGNRLMHVLAFAEQPAIQKKWALAVDINRQFAMDLESI